MRWKTPSRPSLAIITIIIRAPCEHIARPYILRRAPRAPRDPITGVARAQDDETAPETRTARCQRQLSYNIACLSSLPLYCYLYNNLLVIPAHTFIILTLTVSRPPLPVRVQGDRHSTQNHSGITSGKYSLFFVFCVFVFFDNLKNKRL